MAKKNQVKRDSQAAALLAWAWREAFLWIAGAVSILLFIALATYDPTDPGFSFTGEAGPVANATGALGAWIADALFFLVGKPAFLFPFALLVLTVIVHRARKRAEKLELAVRGVGFLLTLVASAGLASLHFDSQPLPGSAGGAIGNVIGIGLAEVLGMLGITVMLLACWLTGVSLMLKFSWLSVIDFVGHWTLRSLEYLRFSWDRWRTTLASRRVRQQREEVVKTVRATKSSTPRIEPVISQPKISERVERERQAPLFDTPAHVGLPPLKLLKEAPPTIGGYSEGALTAMSRQVELKLKDFGVDVEVESVHPGPVVTRFELALAPGLKVAKVSALSKDIARALSVISVRVVEVIPGKSVIGLEIPNEVRELVTLGDVLQSEAYESKRSPLALALGKDISGDAMVVDLAKMPHLMIAGTTGSGKSVAINAMILSLLYKASADEVRMIMIDPKMLELSVYEGIPHLLAPVVTDMKEAANALRWCVAEMDRRYRMMSMLGVRNIGGYNRKVAQAKDKGVPLVEIADLSEEEQAEFEHFPLIVVIIDELADMMMIVGKKVEELIARLAQKARASGIHLVVATQRPSVDVITGLIKANIPCRIAFQVSSRVDSRTILDQMGAETLLGHGDMLYLPTGSSIPFRVHGAYVDDDEVHAVVRHLKRNSEPSYVSEVLEGPKEESPSLSNMAMSSDDESDPLYDKAVFIVTETRRASISGVQRRLKIGYNRAARLVEAMEAVGIVGPLQSNGSREVLAPPPVAVEDA